MERAEFIDRLSQHLHQIKRHHPLRLLISGAGAVGKTTLAGELAVSLTTLGRSVAHASIDDIYLPNRFNPQQEKPLKVQYIEDIFDYPSLIDKALSPCGPNGHRRVHHLIPDTEHNQVRAEAYTQLPEDGVLIVEGVFLMQPSLQHHWDFTLWLDTPSEIRMQRGIQRAQDNDVYFARHLLGHAVDNKQVALQHIYQKVFAPAHRLFRYRYQPRQKVDCLVDHQNPKQPLVLNLNVPSTQLSVEPPSQYSLPLLQQDYLN